jgi:hypothetical protein
VDAGHQQRILRWVAESLYVSLYVRSAVPHEDSPHKGPDNDQSAPLDSLRVQPLDIKSFVASKTPKSDNQFAAVVAYFHRFVSPDRQEVISADILQDATRLAGRARLGNPLATLNNAKQQGYLDAAGRGMFRVNTVGENLVAMTLPGTGETTRPTATKRSSPKKGAKKQRAR